MEAQKQSEGILVSKIKKKRQKILELKEKLQACEMENKNLKNQVTIFFLKETMETQTKTEKPRVKSSLREETRPVPLISPRSSMKVTEVRKSPRNFRAAVEES